MNNKIVFIGTAALIVWYVTGPPINTTAVLGLTPSEESVAGAIANGQLKAYHDHIAQINAHSDTGYTGRPTSFNWTYVYHSGQTDIHGPFAQAYYAYFGINGNFTKTHNIAGIRLSQYQTPDGQTYADVENIVYTNGTEKRIPAQNIGFTMKRIDQSLKGKRIMLIRTDDPYAQLKKGDMGTHGPTTGETYLYAQAYLMQHRLRKRKLYVFSSAQDICTIGL